MATDEGADGEGLYRKDSELEKLELTVRLRPLCEFVASMVGSRLRLRQPADQEDVVQDVMQRLVGKLRDCPPDELRRLARRPTLWAIRNYLRQLERMLAVVDPAYLDGLPATAGAGASRAEFLPEFVVFASGLRPAHVRVCMAIYSGCTGLQEIARVSGVAVRNVGVVLAQVVFHAKENRPLGSISLG